MRAYPTGEALGDTGWIATAEGRYLIPGWKVAGGDVTVSGFWDQGWVRINENNPQTNAGVANNRRLSGYGVGASLGKDGDFVLRASAAWRSTPPTQPPVVSPGSSCANTAWTRIVT